jgi:PAAR motif
MPDSPLNSSADILSFDILINSQPIKATYQVISIEVERAVFRIPTARIILALSVDSGDNQTFAASESGDFIPGVEIDIKLGTDSKKETVFRGIIVNQGIRNLRGEINELILHCSDQSAKMILGRKSAYYQDMTDSAIMGSILGDYGLSSEIEATTYIHKQLVNMCVCVGPPDSIVKGSATVMISGRPAARMGDTTAHGGSIVLGDPTVMIGGWKGLTIFSVALIASGTQYGCRTTQPGRYGGSQGITDPISKFLLCSLWEHSDLD